MADLFWRRRLKKQERQILLSLPNLPADIDDNVFIATGVSAAEQDRRSGAYDEFMFSEDGFAAMPYELSVDEFIDLQIQRTPERQGRAELPHRLRLEYFKARAERLQVKVDDARKELAIVGDLVSEEGSVLEGVTEGENESKWKGVKPDVTSKTKHATRRLFAWLIFLAVGAIDAVIIFLSLRELTDTESEAFWFMLPAVGVQVLFPHIVGKSLGSLRRKQSKRAEDIVIAVTVGAFWLTYVYAMTIIRINFLKKSYFDANSEEMPGNLQTAAFILSLFILIGLGSWLMIRAMSENPHEQKYSRLRYVTLAKNRKLLRAQKSLSKALADVTAEEAVIAEIAAQWTNRAAKYPEVAQSAKSTYRRALVNQQGAPEFTATYLPKEQSNLKKNRGQ